MGEGAAFIKDCIDTYEELCPDHGAIPSDDTELNRIVKSGEEPHELIVEKHFMVMDKKDIQEKMPRDCDLLAPAVLQRILREEKIDSPKAIKDFKQFLRTRYGVAPKSVRIDDKIIGDRYIGIREKRTEEKTAYDQDTTGTKRKF
jgi:hypothetical protein